jgi:hypothetical protein
MKEESSEAAFVCPHVFADTRPVLLVSKSDGDWQFLCGKDDFNNGDECHVVCLDHVLNRDPTLVKILDFPDDWEAERKRVGGAWKRRGCDVGE